jgi:hypothetical protein
MTCLSDMQLIDLPTEKRSLTENELHYYIQYTDINQIQDMNMDKINKDFKNPVIIEKGYGQQATMYLIVAEKIAVDFK